MLIFLVQILYNGLAFVLRFFTSPYKLFSLFHGVRLSSFQDLQKNMASRALKSVLCPYSRRGLAFAFRRCPHPCVPITTFATNFASCKNSDVQSPIKKQDCSTVVPVDELIAYLTSVGYFFY